MKQPLQNPIVVGILVIAALALVFRNAFGPMRTWLKTRKNQSVAVAPAVPTVSVAPTNLASATSTNTPEREAPWKKAAATQEWTKAPKRDPFQFVPLPQPYQVVLGTNLPGLTQPVKTAQELLALKAIWLQTGSNLAVVNGKVVEEGSSISDYKVDKIEADKIWVTGPIGQERVLFGVGTNAISTNLPPMTLPGTAIPATPPPDTRLSSSVSKN